MFGLLTPAMGIGNAIDAKRRGRRSDRGEAERFRRELGEFRTRLASLADDDRRRMRAAYPDPAEVMRRVALPSTTLWERRPGHPDFLRLRAGVGGVPWSPPVAQAGPGTEPPDELAAALAESELLDDAPVPVALAAGGVVGVVGDRGAALAVARSLLCQAAALHGPADLPVMILSSAAAAPAWDWAKWLPHTRDAGGVGRMLSHDPELSARLVEAHLRPAGGRDRADRSEPAPGPTVLVVVDDESLTEGRKAPTRSLLRGEGGPVAGVVIASTVDRLPAVCTTVIEMTDPDGRADLTLPQQGRRIAGFLAAGMADDAARDCARSLARFEDPELDVAGAGLPASIRLLPLLDLEDCTPDAVLARWKAGGIDPPPPSAWPRTGCSASTSWPTGPTGSSAGRPAPASPSCCARWSPGWRPASTPTTSRSCWSTSRAAARSTSVPGCPTRSAWSPTSTSTWPSGRCAASRPSCATASGCCATLAPSTCPTTCARACPRPCPGCW
jgi:S-DNA-T family DNA segregation ATPase FtsK/SpoIIIE